MTTPCQLSHELTARDEDMCGAEAVGKDYYLLCWLADGHDGDHWDDVDKIHWHVDGDGRITPRRTIETPCPGGAS